MSSATAQTRIWMDAAGHGPTGQPTTGTTHITMAPGTSRVIETWIVDADPRGSFPASYQLITQCTAHPQPNAAGIVEYVDNNPGMGGGDSMFIDVTHNDFVFGGCPTGDPLYNESCSFDIFGAGLSTASPLCDLDIYSGQPDGAYLATFEISASEDACGTHVVMWNRSENGGRPPLAAFFAPGGAPWEGGDQPTEWMNLEVHVEGCCDVDQDGIRDDACVWCSCDGCAVDQQIDIVFGDMGGPFGECLPDGVTDNNDRFHALNCFSNVSATGTPGAYPCESNAPVARNVDAGGAFGSCIPDGVCDGHDAFLALNAFSGTTSCSCPLDGGPAPVTTTGQHNREETAIELSASRHRLTGHERTEIRVYLQQPVRDLRGYQLHIGSSGGEHGALEIVDISIEEGSAFAKLGAWSAFNTATGQMVTGLDTPGVAVHEGTYLATFTLESTPDARGTFIVDLLHDDADHRTFLFPTRPIDRITLSDAKAARIVVEPQRLRRPGGAPVER